MPENYVQEPEVPAETRPYEDAEAEAVPLRHPFDTLADLAREQFAAHFIHSTVVLFRLGGQFGVFLGVIALISLGAAVGSKVGVIDGAVPYGATMPLAAAGVIALLIGQYAAGHLFPAMEELDRTARATLSATGPLDSLGWAMTALGLSSLVGLAAYAMATSTAWPAFLAVASFVVCQFTAIVAWNPRAVWLNVGPATTPGREAAALICFLGKVLWRLSIVGFGTGILLGSLATLNVAVHIGLPAEPDPVWLGMELISPLCLLLAAVPLPAVGYLGFLACQLLAELVVTGLGGTDRRR
jgi:hypothetical protein